jgi:hypothetical protein
MPDRRIATPERLVSEIAAWERQRNATRAQVKSLRIHFINASLAF